MSSRYSQCNWKQLKKRPLASTNKVHNSISIDSIIVNNHFLNISLDDAFLLFRAFVFYISILIEVLVYLFSIWRIDFSPSFCFINSNHESSFSSFKHIHLLIHRRMKHFICYGINGIINLSLYS